MKRLLLLLMPLLIFPSIVSANFTETNSTPPAGNTPVPLNSSNDTQLKRGALVSNSYMQADVFYDRYNYGFYLDPNGVSVLNDIRPSIIRDRNDSGFYLDPNRVSILNDIRPSIIYDRNNTGYYLDPNGSSRLNAVYADDLYSYGYANVRNIYLRDVGRWASDTSNFGGMWTINMDGSCRYTNYRTGGCSCPGGFGTYGFSEFNGGANCTSGHYTDSRRTTNCGIRSYYCGR